MTRAQLEADILTGLDRPMMLVGLDGTTQDGTNADLNQPIRNALLEVGIVTADPFEVTDGDLVNLSRYAVGRVLALVEIDIIKAVLLKFTDADVWNKENFDKDTLARQESRFRAYLRDAQDRLERWHDYPLDSIAGGTISGAGFLPFGPCESYAPRWRSSFFIRDWGC